MTQSRTRKCWSCKQRRLKCDGGMPHCLKCWSHGVECLGYEKPLVWVEGVARRGPMKNRTFGDAQTQQPSQKTSLQRPTPVVSHGHRHQKEESTRLSGSIPIPVALVEPLFKDFSYTSRFFVDYFSKCICPTLVLQDQLDNPYRNVIPWINTPTVASAIMTVSSCHYIQYITNCPMAELLPQTRNGTVLGRLNAHIRSLVNYHLRSKSHCLGLVSTALAIHRTTQDQQSLLITVVLLAFLDIFESGSGAWSYHIEGIKKMLEVGAMKGTSSWDDNLQSLLHDAAMLQTFGSSLAKPGVLTSASTLSSIKASAFSTVTPNGCPVQILSTVEIFASQRRHDFVFLENATNIVVLEDALQKMRSYDIASWAVYNTTQDSKVSSEDLARLGTIWQLSADIYACRVLACLTGSTLASESLQVQGLIAAYAFLEREDDELIKCLIWPTFVAGAASTTYEARAWVLQTLDRIWSRGHCANTKNAAKVLGKLWEKYDQTTLGSSHIHNSSNATEHLSMGYSVWDWVNELSSLEGSWLFI
ncbi:hypothetical protein FOZG_15926 [Fusarium oxysporum Fo47]|uniref:Zn(2)-C6 fungal-type domain-containing protein n=1 Tax=Fusarium oxysporum Fo47 TaxID=660027 RepID=W9JM36_FUSOX|nr:hypothetical protein FOZG_15926 [Fusarium oxysporum Fo47]